MAQGNADWIFWQYPKQLRPGLVHDSSQSYPAGRSIFQDKVLNDGVK